MRTAATSTLVRAICRFTMAALQQFEVLVLCTLLTDCNVSASKEKSSTEFLRVITSDA